MSSNVLRSTRLIWEGSKNGQKVGFPLAAVGGRQLIELFSQAEERFGPQNTPFEDRRAGQEARINRVPGSVCRVSEPENRVARAAEMCRLFDAGAPAEQIFAV